MTGKRTAEEALGTTGGRADKRARAAELQELRERVGAQDVEIERLRAQAAVMEHLRAQADALVHRHAVELQEQGVEIERLRAQAAQADALVHQHAVELQEQDDEIERLRAQAAQAGVLVHQLAEMQKSRDFLRQTSDKQTARLQELVQKPASAGDTQAIVKELAKAVKEEAAVANTINFTHMATYTHADFIKRVKLSTPVLVELVYDIVRAGCEVVDGSGSGSAAFEVQQVLGGEGAQGSISSSAHAAATPTSRCTVSEELRVGGTGRSVDIKVQQTVALVLAALLNAYDPLFTWEYASIQSYVMRAVCRSPMLTDQLAASFPGACSSSALDFRIHAFAEELMHSGVKLDTTAVVTIIYDNIPGSSKKYINKSSRGGKDAQKAGTIATAMEANLRWGSSEQENIQKLKLHSPRNDKPICAEMPMDLHMLNARRMDGDDYSEVEHLKNEVLGYLGTRLQSVMDVCGIGLATAVPVPAFGVAVEAEEELKICGHMLEVGCGASCPARARTCFLCNNTLPTLTEWRNHHQAPKILHTVEFFSEARVSSDYGRGLKSYVKMETGAAIKGSASVVTPSAARELPTLSAEQPTLSLFDTLPTLPYNPSGHDTITLIYNEIGSVAEVHGFVDNPQRSWTYISADRGASFLALLDMNRLTSKYGALRYVPSTGHEMMSLEKMLLKIMREYGYDVFASAYGFESDRQQDILLNGFDNHICNEWIMDVCRPIVTDALIEAYLDSQPTGVSIEGLQSWLADDVEDVHWRNHVYLAIDLLAAYTLYIKGQRANDFAAYNAGRKTLLPLLFAVGHYNYAYVIVRDIYEYEYRCTEEVRLDRKRNFTQGSSDYNHQGWDFHCEETVKSQKSLVASNNADAFLVAAQMSQSHQSLRNTLAREGGRGGSATRGKAERSKTKLHMTMAECCAAIAQCREQLRKQQGRTVVSTLDGTKQNYESMELLTMIKATEKKIGLYERSAFTNKKQFAKYKLRSLEKRGAGTGGQSGARSAGQSGAQSAVQSGAQSAGEELGEEEQDAEEEEAAEEELERQEREAQGSTPAELGRTRGITAMLRERVGEDIIDMLHE